MVRRHVRIAILHRALDLDRALDSFDHAREFDEEAIANCLDDAALVLGDLRVDELSSMRLERRQGPRLVATHQSATADDVGGDDGGEHSGHAHTRSGSRAWGTKSTPQGANGHRVHSVEFRYGS